MSFYTKTNIKQRWTAYSSVTEHCTSTNSTPENNTQNTKQYSDQYHESRRLHRAWIWMAFLDPLKNQTSYHWLMFLQSDIHKFIQHPAL